MNCPYKSCCLFPKRLDVEVLTPPKNTFFTSLGRPSFEIECGSPIHWRTRAKLAIRGTKESPLIGIFKPGTHEVIDIPCCPFHHPSIQDVCLKIKQWIIDFQIEPYDELSGKGILRYVQLTVERQTDKVQVVLVVNSNDINVSFKNLILSFWHNHHPILHSIWSNGNTRRDNVIFGEEWVLLHGEKFLWEKLCGNSICFHPASFMQANLEMFEKLLIHLQAYVPQGVSVLELFSGTGSIGISLLDQVQRLFCVEVNEQAKRCFEQSMGLFPPELQKKSTFLVTSSDKVIELLDQNFDLIVVDPPRKGCGQKVLNALCEISRPCRLVYVSCGWDSFQKECKALLHSGWNLVEAKGFWFFPGTEHLEILAIFDKIPSP